MAANKIGELGGSRLKISCLSVDCPERQGGLCQYDPRRTKIVVTKRWLEGPNNVKYKLEKIETRVMI